MKRSLFYIVWALLLVACKPVGKQEITMLQWNIWQEGVVVEGGYDAIVNEIERLHPDFVTLSEVRNYEGVDFTQRLVDSLAVRGLTYYSFLSYDTGLLSRYPITDMRAVYPVMSDHGSIHRITTVVDGLKLAVYTAHLDYLDDAYYNVRGYDGSSWKEIPIPTSVEEVLERNVASQRDEAIRTFLRQAEVDCEAGYTVLLGGDFNEPSHADWTEEVSHLYDHHGLAIPWTVSTLLEEAGYTDAYRAFFPNVLTHPGFTFPSDNPAMPVENLTWAPKADERDRIDFVWYDARPGTLAVQDVSLFGPRGSIVRSQRVEETSEDPFIEPLGVWPTDHKGLLVTFRRLK